MEFNPFPGFRESKQVDYNSDGVQDFVAVLVNARLSAGQYDAVLNASGLSSGVYFYRLQASGAANQNFVQTKKMMLVK